MRAAQVLASMQRGALTPLARGRALELGAQLRRLELPPAPAPLPAAVPPPAAPLYAPRADPRLAPPRTSPPPFRGDPRGPPRGGWDGRPQEAERRDVGRGRDDARGSFEWRGGGPPSGGWQAPSGGWPAARDERDRFAARDGGRGGHEAAWRDDRRRQDERRWHGAGGGGGGGDRGRVDSHGWHVGRSGDRDPRGR
jgi:hypothetical protein